MKHQALESYLYLPSASLLEKDECRILSSRAQPNALSVRHPQLESGVCKASILYLNTPSRKGGAEESDVP